MTAVNVVAQVVSALEQIGVPCMAVGPFSVNLYAQPRSTKDADFVVQLGQTPITRLMEVIGAAFTLDPQITFETVTSTTRYRLHHRQTQFLVELFLLSDDPHDLARFSRRVSGEVLGHRIAVPTPEDVIITKLRWSRQGQRSKDREECAECNRRPARTA